MKLSKMSLFTSVVVAGSIAFSAPVRADYPPVEGVKPSTIIKELSFDRTPTSVAASTRKVTASVAPGATTAVKVFLGEVFTPVVPNCPPLTRFKVTVRAANGKSITLPSVKSLANGRLRLPTIAITKTGRYVAKVTAPNGKVRTIRINVGK